MLILMILTKLTNLRTQVFILSKWHNLTLFSFYYSQRKSVAKEVYTMVFTTKFLSWIMVSFWSKPKPYLIKSYSSFSVFFIIICWLCFIFSNYILSILSISIKFFSAFWLSSSVSSFYPPGSSATLSWVKKVSGICLSF